ncbi:dolichol-phosphate mannosyltransferase subunit 3 [Crucibulum laeve]|uniref:Dolichol-phosphate mannosyltransferase subunit 3 n=1 Tax=Crucibulum laeve TaxID=68775 RepID=A0A5C3MEB4_9AGAR|nr:dolichol-phosphate mannosyltransferase subunit 3 [Crucibulum laeve]
MARAHRVAFLLSFITAAYLLTFFQVLSVPLVDDKVAQEVLPVLPWWLLVSFGSYCLWSLGWGVFTFRDCPDAYTELLGEVSEAKNDLRAKGVTVD